MFKFSIPLLLFIFLFFSCINSITHIRVGAFYPPPAHLQPQSGFIWEFLGTRNPDKSNEKLPERILSGSSGSCSSCSISSSNGSSSRSSKQ
ncbi:hypothetical protein DDB_G0293808 [Dictyostelium discoideum AX4]|uniref:Putative uncharacterized protein DDB_G0293808 n=1 Tax=Dictyostelium discoideum TaxID=44689 RepID=Y2135_DICDI|nr:hypothetical protein DDB_G0293808 [Dictyostelium discoideum AX4]Q54B95.1 RecName: Full=Putative uncharacterized protein DDB_G0293808; Flags: Precursor [Dictyostelium discoideum]EAL60537.1 hypothetical protein DDB_G0293808 [Dictyostelium discoideum AX4]|eukprot:XP_628955.1 hypothetical protein DDB_G0293808 [Dictyostelium discoideum AX4]